ncbi:hypothetical protein [Desulfobacula sp.]|uniref:hypothetical protein n=1 Tax=Desulfobacula sp. TaxID=2593537 RepID=UPI002626C7A2|nr:hypothetical protein [Desulfobacula sp.]
MTTVPGHNIVIQQSVAVQELAHQTHTPKPSPEQVLAQQEATARVKNTTVQEFDASEKLTAKKEKDALKKKRNEKKRTTTDQEPGATGRLLDTMI